MTALAAGRIVSAVGRKSQLYLPSRRVAIECADIYLYYGACFKVLEILQNYGKVPTQ
jgi:hypothetical protein